MKCHYEVLGVSRTASNDEIMKAYRRLALKWRPKKNTSNPEEAKEQFQVIQQAWEVLSDADERSWYGQHRQAILKGGDYKDVGINLFRYFSTDCVKSYKDDEKGFYSIYRLLFEKIAAEDAEFAEKDDSHEEIPTFGDSTSSYDDIVHNFYAYWENYNTKKSFVWLNPYDLRYLPNKKVARLAEKENKRIRDKAKRERNAQIRNLVAFIRKRDKRVEAHEKVVAERAVENAKKALLRKKQQRLQRQELKSGKMSKWWHWSNFFDLENESKIIKANLAAEFGEQLSLEADASCCRDCNELFKAREASRNENSNKGEDNVIALNPIINEEDEQSSSEESDYSDDNILSETEESDIDEYVSDEDSETIERRQQLRIDMDYESSSDEEFMSVQELKDEDKSMVPSDKPKRKSKRKNGRGSPKNNISDDEDDANNIDDTDWLSKKQRKKQQQKKAMSVSSIEQEKQNVKERRQRRQMERQIRDRDTIFELSKIEDININCWGHFCELCSAEFTTKNKLLEHLKKTGHAAYMPDKTKNKKNNGKQALKTKGNFYRRNN